MNKTASLNIFLFSLLYFSVIGCNDSVDRNKQEESDILKTPAFVSINDSIRQFPQNAALYLQRAKMLSQNNANDIAYKDYKTSWELNPTREAGLLYASNLSIVGKLSQKVDLLKDCLEKFPSDPEFSRLMGETYIESGKINAAMEFYDDLLKKDSANFEAWYEKGLLFEQLKDTTKAIVAQRKAYSIQPVNTYALELAHLYAENKNAIAVRICDDVIEKDSTKQLIDPFFIKGIYYSNTKQYKAAIVEFDSCIRRDWKFTEAYIEKGICFFKQDNYDVAMNTFHMATTVSNTDPDAYYWMGRCYEVINKKEEAIAYYERAVALDKNFIEAKQALKRLKS